VLLHAVARLVLHPAITNIQASWVKMGPQAAGQLLAAGCNDMGGSIMNESITRAAGEGDAISRFCMVGLLFTDGVC
jgi:FO synthase